MIKKARKMDPLNGEGGFGNLTRLLDTQKGQHDYRFPPGDPGPFSPRHHGVHYHIELKPNNLSWKQSEKQKSLLKVKPENYQPGHGTGFLPGEKHPGY